MQVATHATSGRHACNEWSPRMQRVVALQVDTMQMTCQMIKRNPKTLNPKTLKP